MELLRGFFISRLKRWGSFSAMFTRASAPLQLFLVVWILLRALGVICYGRTVLTERSQKLLQGLVSHEITAYLSVFNLFKLN